MITVEFYSKDDCSLCDDVRATLGKLQKEFPFRVNEIRLAEPDPLFEKFRTRFPVVVAGGIELSGKISEDALRNLLEPGPPTPLFYFSKFLEALGMVTVLFGLIYGLLGDMWTDLYFFIGGIVVFALGRFLEKRDEVQRDLRRRARQQIAGTLQQ
jgi:hypothetical protein